MRARNLHSGRAVRASHTESHRAVPQCLAEADSHRLRILGGRQGPGVAVAGLQMCLGVAVGTCSGVGSTQQVEDHKRHYEP